MKEFIKTHVAKDGFKADVYKSISSVNGEMLYSAYAHNVEPNSINILFGGSYFAKLEDVVKIIG